MRAGATLILLLTANGVFGQASELFKPDPHRRELAAVKIAGNIRIDGLLNEPEWSLTPGATDFIQVEPSQGKPSQFGTVVKVLYNQRFLYVGVICKDPRGRKAIMATDFMRDFDYLRHDLIDLAFDTYNDQRNALVFATNAYGVQRDLLSFDDLYYDVDWNGLWAVRTSRSDSGWTAEMALPWKTLRYPRLSDTVQSWGFNVYRNRRLTNEISAFSPFPRIYSAAHMNYAGLLTGLQPPPPTTNVTVNPYLLLERDHYSNFGNPPPPNATSVKAGGDLKWAITPNSVLDLTAHTDFAQADVEQQVNNTSRFSVFFPEKRGFFLENASLFGVQVNMAADQSGGSMRYQPFNSRTIGLNVYGDPVPIVGGGRFVHRSLTSNYGAMAIRQDGADGLGPTNFFVGRYSRNFAQQDRVGTLVTVKNQSATTNIESTVDGFFRLGEANSINAIFTQTTNTNGGPKGFGGIVQYYNTNNHHELWVTQSVFTRGFDPQMGFLSRSNVIGTTPGYNVRYRGKLLPFKRVLLAFEPGIIPELYFTASTGRFEEADIPVFPIWLNFKNGGYIGYGFSAIWQHLSTTFAPLEVEIAPGDYHYFNHQLYLMSDPSKKVSGQATITTGSYFNGRLTTGDFKLVFAPVPYVNLQGEYNRNDFERVGINRTTTTVNLYILQCRLALNPRVQFTGIYQHNSLNHSDAYNLRFAWEFSPLSYIYLIYNRGVIGPLPQAGAKAQAEDHAIFKASYLKQF